ncbi:MAG TPA: GntR family transcriptional regulator [Bryobacteraceae bacterium]|nr:GntR family transcriptional regulator [Bryobacteraceae bacterium]
MIETYGQLAPLKTGSLRSLVVGALRDAIFSGRFQPGEALRETQLAKEFQVSQATVREGLLELEHVGLVTRIPNVSTTVTKLSREAVRERLTIRLVLEQLAAVESARNCSAKDFLELEQLAQGILGAVSRNAYFESAKADLAFHRAIWRLSGNSTLYRTLDSLTAPLFAFASLRRSSGQAELTRMIGPHGPLVSALRSGNPDEIRRVVSLHVLAGYRDFPETDAADADAIAKQFGASGA